MRKIGFKQTENGVKEILHNSYKIDSVVKKRRMFFMMINELLDDESKISVKNNSLFQSDILSIFTQKIESFFQIYRLRPQKSQKVVKIYIDESALFNQFFKISKNKKFQYLSRNHMFVHNFKPKLGYLHAAAKLISMIFNGKDIEMMIDLNFLFATTVYKRIKPEDNKKITLQLPYIYIDQHGLKTRLHPQWKSLDSSKIEKISKEINESLESMSEIDQCYLIYPKTENFQRHIRVKDSKENKEIKIIPYSFTFCNR